MEILTLVILYTFIAPHTLNIVCMADFMCAMTTKVKQSGCISGFPLLPNYITYQAMPSVYAFLAEEIKAKQVFM